MDVGTQNITIEVLPPPLLTVSASTVTPAPLDAVVGGPKGADGYTPVKNVDYFDGTNGVDGLGFTGGSYNGSTGVVSFTSDDGLGFATGDIRGADGADGKTILTGSGSPSSGLGTSGDMYIDTTANNIYGPKTAGVWGSGTSLIGPQGVSVPTGGTSGQQLVKNSSTDYDYSWQTPAGSGDMLKSTYDPSSKNANAFSQDNMVDGTTNKNYTATEKTKLSGIEAGAEVNDVTSVAGKTGAVTLGASDLTATGISSTKYLRGDNTWQIPTNSTYTSITGATIATTTATVTLTVDRYQIMNYSSGKLTATLPASASVGSVIEVFGLSSGGFRVVAPSGDNIIYPDGTDSGSAGYVDAPQYATVTLRCVVASTTWVVTKATLLITNNNGKTMPNPQSW